MGRWTPLILMAGGLAILLGTLLGINFPMNGRNAEVRGNRRESQVLPANINVNSTEANGASGSNRGAAAQSGSNSVTQNNNSTNPGNIQSAPTRTAQNSGSSTSGSSSSNAQSSSNSNTQSQSETSGNKPQFGPFGKQS